MTSAEFRVCDSLKVEENLLTKEQGEGKYWQGEGKMARGGEVLSRGGKNGKGKGG